MKLKTITNCLQNESLSLGGEVDHISIYFEESLHVSRSSGICVCIQKKAQYNQSRKIAKIPGKTSDFLGPWYLKARQNIFLPFFHLLLSYLWLILHHITPSKLLLLKLLLLLLLLLFAPSHVFVLELECLTFIMVRPKHKEPEAKSELRTAAGIISKGKERKGSGWCPGIPNTCTGFFLSSNTPRRRALQSLRQKGEFSSHCLTPDFQEEQDEGVSSAWITS